VNCFKKCGFNLNQSSGVEDAAEHSISWRWLGSAESRCIISWICIMW
jgi:hypothetical protein